MASACAAAVPLQRAAAPAQRQRRQQPVTCSLRSSHGGALAGWGAQRQAVASGSGRRVRSQGAAGAAGADGQLGSSWMDQPETAEVAESVEVFPRLKERDPYRRLGVGREASFEEVQDAHNFLREQYAKHEPSRESIELALDSILQEKMKVRHRDGFRPPQRGRRGEVEGDAPRQTFFEVVRSYFEPSVASTTLVNDGSVFLLLGLWAAWTAAASDPTLPLGASLAFAAWKLYDKRNKRNPDGPFWGGNAMWGALGATVLTLILGSILSYGLVQVVPLPPRLASEAVGFFLIVLLLGFTTIFLK